jgi:hypothetical protein
MSTSEQLSECAFSLCGSAAVFAIIGVVMLATGSLAVLGVIAVLFALVFTWRAGTVMQWAVRHAEDERRALEAERLLRGEPSGPACVHCGGIDSHHHTCREHA